MNLELMLTDHLEEARAEMAAEIAQLQEQLAAARRRLHFYEDLAATLKSRQEEA